MKTLMQICVAVNLLCAFIGAIAHEPTTLFWGIGMAVWCAWVADRTPGSGE